MITCKRATGTIGAVHPRSQTDDDQPGVGIAKGRNRSTVIARLPEADSVHKCGQTQAAPAARVKSGAHVRQVAIANWALQQKTGYAETPRSPPSITRGFGLTRAQPNPRPNLRAGTRQTNCRRENSAQLVKIYLLVVRALEASRHPSRKGRKRFASQNSTCTRRGKPLFKKRRTCSSLILDISYNSLNCKYILTAANFDRPAAEHR